MEIKQYTKELIPDILQFERDLRSEENFWGWEIDEKHLAEFAELPLMCACPKSRPHSKNVP